MYTAVDEARDRDHLKLLAIFHYVYGGLCACGMCCSSVYIVMGVRMMAAPPASTGQGLSTQEAQTMGMFFVVIACIVILYSLICAFANVVAGISIHRHRRRVLCCVVAGLNCLSIPMGLILAIFTFIVLLRPSVKAMFDRSAYDQSVVSY